MTISSKNEFLALRLLAEKTVKNMPIRLEHHVLKDLMLYGDDFQDLIDSFFEERKVRISPEDYDDILKLVPSEWYGVLGGVFCRRKNDVTVEELLKRLDEIIVQSEKRSESV